MPGEAALEVVTLPEVEVPLDVVLGAVFVEIDDEVEVEDALDDVEGKESDGG